MAESTDIYEAIEGLKNASAVANNVLKDWAKWNAEHSTYNAAIMRAKDRTESASTASDHRLASNLHNHAADYHNESAKEHLRSAATAASAGNYRSAAESMRSADAHMEAAQSHTYAAAAHGTAAKNNSGEDADSQQATSEAWTQTARATGHDNEARKA